MAEERTMATRRHNDLTKAIRKQRIVKNWCDGAFGDYYNNLHQYSENKIHCSCPMCRNKTTNKGKHKSIYLPTYNPPMHDKKQLAESIDELVDEAYLLYLDNELLED